MKKAILITIISFALLGLVGGGFYWKITHKGQVSGVEDKIINTPVNSPTSIIPSIPNPTPEPINTTKPVKDTSTPTPVIKPDNRPVCDESRKVALTNQYNSDIARILAVKNKKWDEALIVYNNEVNSIDQTCGVIWDPEARGQCRKTIMEMAGRTLDGARELANMDYNADKLYLDAMLSLDLKSINC